MKNSIVLIIFIISFSALSQESIENSKALKASKVLTWEANEDLEDNEFVLAEAKYRRAIDKSKENVAAPYNLGNAYYERDSYLEAFGRFKEAGENAASKPEKHRAFHNMGNVFMKNKEYEKAVEAYKEALRNDPTDEETRYNLALAKEMLKKQQEEQPQDQDKEDQEDQQDKKDEQNEDKEEQDQGDQPDENDQNDENKANQDESEDGDQGDQEKEDNKEGEGDEKQEKKEPQQNDKQSQQPRPNQLSPQQIENLLEAMQNEERKVQEKMDAQKVKGVPVKNKKDW